MAFTRAFEVSRYGLEQFAFFAAAIVVSTWIAGGHHAVAGEPIQVQFATVSADAGGEPFGLDLYLHQPDEGDGHHLVVWIHGGGWKGGNAKGCPLKFLTEHGYAVASISYRLTDKAIFPAQIHDCKGAIRWLREHQADYRYDASKIVVAGSSAGGHLAALVGTSGDVAELEGAVGGSTKFSSRVNGVIDYYGATDFILRSKTQPSRANEPGSVVHLLLGGGADTKTELAKTASAFHHVTDDDPPMLVLHGTNDNTVLPDQSGRIAQGYANTRLPLTLHLIPGAGHGGNVFYSGEARKWAVDFIAKTFADVGKAAK